MSGLRARRLSAKDNWDLAPVGCDLAGAKMWKKCESSKATTARDCRDLDLGRPLSDSRLATTAPTAHNAAVAATATAGVAKERGRVVRLGLGGGCDADSSPSYS